MRQQHSVFPSKTALLIFVCVAFALIYAIAQREIETEPFILPLQCHFKVTIWYMECGYGYMGWLCWRVDKNLRCFGLFEEMRAHVTEKYKSKFAESSTKNRVLSRVERGEKISTFDCQIRSFVRKITIRGSTRAHIYAWRFGEKLHAETFSKWLWASNVLRVTRSGMPGGRCGRYWFIIWQIPQIIWSISRSFRWLEMRSVNFWSDFQPSCWIRRRW